MFILAQKWTWNSVVVNNQTLMCWTRGKGSELKLGVAKSLITVQKKFDERYFPRMTVTRFLSDLEVI